MKMIDALKHGQAPGDNKHSSANQSNAIVM